MITVPLALYEKWGPLWSKALVPDRPWWALRGRRCDGVTLLDSATLDRDEKGWHDKRGRWDHPEDLLDAMARIDREYPLEAPPPMEGQVWVQIEGAGRYLDKGNSFCIVAVRGCDVVAVVRDGDEPRLGVLHTWPPRGAVLVAGPTPWGRDVPWAPSEALLRATRTGSQP